MHRSRIGVILIDHPEESYDAAPGEDPYESLDRLPGDHLLELQRTGAGTPPRIHLDIETDDVAAEVGRLVGLGAEVAEERGGYRIMRDPGGLVFCVAAETERTFSGRGAAAGRPP
ncbi:MAG: VOC family protein [Nocardioides sp.]